jgi:hypothetical protein
MQCQHALAGSLACRQSGATVGASVSGNARRSDMAQAIRCQLILHRGPGAPPLTAGATVGASVSGDAGPSGMAQAFPVARDQAAWRKRFRCQLILHRGPGAPPLTAGATVGASISGDAGPSGMAQAFPVTRDQAGWRKRFRCHPRSDASARDEPLPGVPSLTLRAYDLGAPSLTLRSAVPNRLLKKTLESQTAADDLFHDLGRTAVDRLDA